MCIILHKHSMNCLSRIFFSVGVKIKKDIETTPVTSLNSIESESEGGPRRSARKKETIVPVTLPTNNSNKENKKTGNG